ncbi:tetratricopeptide repeat protein [Corallococcus praedator]|uniref:Tetratricopeptide repeat protein n=1 Tax=Corallococcus praedator TaxID=2316724 RepID=A0ABX9QHU3_9BACT|nr:MULTISPECIES: tetratricopeptide repeat protein [Corallococcus]RKH14667.1 tetratricopeptide repeat protein [Corallococcus sp. CA047B]RKH32301.1 tetratricopeptide repeat protein [Corallococcus sp. CA031C]RKI08551.1 tetratricopeptide repeat protein [Corallococcus praedator]
MKTPHALPSFRLLGGLLGLCLCGVGPAFGQAGGPSAPAASRDYFTAAMAETARLHDDLEYEQALAAVTRAKRLARSDAERAAAALYEGIVLADMGQRDAAMASFRAGLRLTPDAKLPVKVSPKVEGDFEAVRAEVQRERPVMAAPVPAPEVPPRPTDAPAQRTVEAPPPLPSRPVASAPVTSPGVDLRVDAQRTQVRRVPALSWVLLGTGVAAGGAGTLFGLQSRGNVNSAREVALDSSVDGHLEDARGQAVVANVLFGTALAAAAGAVTAYFLSEPTVSEVAP